MKITHYKAYGLIIASDIPLPELETSNCFVANVVITYGNIPKQLPHCLIKRPNWQANNTQLLLTLSKGSIGHFLIESGHKITVEAHPDVAQDALRLYLLGSAFGALLYQRKHVVLHASTVTNGNGAVIICGASGAGKSTTANALLVQGWKILSDDLSVIDLAKCPQVLPAYPQSKLWQNSLNLLNKGTESFQRIRADCDKFKIPLHKHFHNNPEPLKAIFIINKHDIDSVETTELQGVEKIAALRKKSYRKSYVFGEQLVLHLKQCATIANHCPIYSIFRPVSGNSLSDVLSSIIDKTSN